MILIKNRLKKNKDINKIDVDVVMVDITTIIFINCSI